MAVPQRKDDGNGCTTLASASVTASRATMRATDARARIRRAYAADVAAVKPKNTWVLDPCPRGGQYPVHAVAPHDAAGERPGRVVALLLRRPRHAAPAQEGISVRALHARVRGLWSRGRADRPRVHPQLGHTLVRPRERVRPRR